VYVHKDTVRGGLRDIIRSWPQVTVVSMRTTILGSNYIVCRRLKITTSKHSTAAKNLSKSLICRRGVRNL
jgi:hypothetical protein